MIYNFLSEEFQVFSNVSNFLFSLQFQQLEHRLQARQADVPGEPESQLRPPAGRLDLDFYMYDNCTKKGRRIHILEVFNTRCYRFLSTWAPPIVFLSNAEEGKVVVEKKPAGISFDPD